MTTTAVKIFRTLILGAILGCCTAEAGENSTDKTAKTEVVQPFESDTWSIPANGIDTLVFAALSKKGIQPALPCSDEVFVRRVYLDVIGTLPEPLEVTEFLKDRGPGKRAVLIDKLMNRDEFSDYWSLKWCDILRVKAEFPINLWPNAAQAYHHWIHDAVKENLPYDKFVRELLTTSGSNFRDPPVNFYRALQNHTSSSAIAKAVALTFMGTRTEKWPDDLSSGMAVFFSRVAFKKTAEWKEEIVYVDPAPARTLEAVFPDGVKTQIPPDKDPRLVFADWLIASNNPWFAKNIVNRVWSWLLGRGIIHEPDDIRQDNAAANPELLAYLEKELVSANYDLRHIYRLILNSRTYQQSSIPRCENADAGALFAYYQVRRLAAEVLQDALNKITGTGEEYVSQIPEPFTFIPEKQRTILLADGSITSPFLEMFGRPTRDTGLESERNDMISDEQQLHLLNSMEIQRKIERSPRLRIMTKIMKGNQSDLITRIYLLILSRYPTEAETVVEDKYSKTEGLSQKQATDDMIWALINSKEFLYRH